jgi:hypothetical protein
MHGDHYDRQATHHEEYHMEAYHSHLVYKHSLFHGLINKGLHPRLPVYVFSYHMSTLTQFCKSATSLGVLGEPLSHVF